MYVDVSLFDLYTWVPRWLGSRGRSLLLVNLLCSLHHSCLNLSTFHSDSSNLVLFKIFHFGKLSYYLRYFIFSTYLNTYYLWVLTEILFNNYTFVHSFVLLFLPWQALIPLNHLFLMAESRGSWNQCSNLHYKQQELTAVMRPYIWPRRNSL